MSYHRILVPVDDSPLSDAAVKHAVDVAKAFNSTVTVMSVVAVDPFVGVDFYKVAPAVTEHLFEAETNAEAHLQKISDIFSSNGIETNTKIIREEPTATGILNIADEVNADLIIMGSHGRSGLKKLVLGSVAQKVLAESPVPVLIVKA
ncbi:universal stress protein [Acinetobacter ursingii]|uniref:Universal stress protein n=1 Tax=Acinetobacter ursingii TaxID=108980 RepID=A0A2N6VDA6_9GAMM|nr:universal stress protein [Acinetobacter ursingii]MCH2003862.1 universal stress protein [Acinetobacter ursingii]MCU4350093.1 universal stress protein [Acinetobacter ursingii]MCU4380591.1 universal stress protein [Acinetobacter ursingii]MCU4610104.1 universal stress protein [Acinetobacter ursingii]MDI3238931.1 universal stress protein [Acinetobacter ursingii]